MRLLGILLRVGAKLKEVLIWGAKVRDVNSVSSEKLHEFEIFTHKRGRCVRTPRIPTPPLRTGL